MEDFTFISPTKFVLEKGAHKRIGSLVREMAQNVLLVYADDPFMHASGLLNDVRESLEEAGIAWHELTGVQPNPHISVARQGVAMCKEKGVSFVLAVGGGSVIDTAKAVALGALYSGDVWDFYIGAAQPERALPVGAVMTLPATGSEASGGSVMSNAGTGEKRDVICDILRPALCLMNPELTFTLPEKQTAYGVIDMFSHVTERYFTSSEGVQLTDRLCEGAMTAIRECGLAAVKNGRDYDARANLMLAAIVAHNGVLGAGRNQDWCTHMMGAPISGEYGSIHAGTISVLLPVWMEYVCQNAVRIFAQFANRVFSVPCNDADPSLTAKAGIAELRRFINELGLPTTLRELGVEDDSKFEKMARCACFGGTIGGVMPLSQPDIVEIYKRAF